jgi:hypothetical protein
MNGISPANSSGSKNNAPRTSQLKRTRGYRQALRL